MNRKSARRVRLRNTGRRKSRKRDPERQGGTAHTRQRRRAEETVACCKRKHLKKK